MGLFWTQSVSKMVRARWFLNQQSVREPEIFVKTILDRNGSNLIGVATKLFSNFLSESYNLS